METLILVERNNKPFARFIELLRTQPVVRASDIRKIITRSHYYSYILTTLFKHNDTLQEIHPKLYIAKPDFDITATNRVFNMIKKCEILEIHRKKHFYLLQWKTKPNTSRSG